MEITKNATLDSFQLGKSEDVSSEEIEAEERQPFFFLTPQLLKHIFYDTLQRRNKTFKTSAKSMQKLSLLLNPFMFN